MIYGFDYDGTLVRSFSAEPLSGRREKLAALRAERAKTFLATNQSGPVYRAVLNDPKFPTVEEIAERLAALWDVRGLDWQPDLVLICTHPGESHTDWGWEDVAEAVAADLYDLLVSLFHRRLVVSCSLDWRKPNDGMLVFAARYLGAWGDQICYIGDMETDAQAAERAGVGYRWADGFFC